MSKENKDFKNFKNKRERYRFMEKGQLANLTARMFNDLENCKKLRDDLLKKNEKNKAFISSQKDKIEKLEHLAKLNIHAKDSFNRLEELERGIVLAFGRGGLSKVKYLIEHEI